MLANLMREHRHDPHDVPNEVAAGISAFFRIIELAKEANGIASNEARQRAKARAWWVVRMLRRDQWSRTRLTVAMRRWEEANADLVWCQLGMSSFAGIAAQFLMSRWRGESPTIEWLPPEPEAPTLLESLRILSGQP